MKLFGKWDSSEVEVADPQTCLHDRYVEVISAVRRVGRAHMHGASAGHSIEGLDGELIVEARRLHESGAAWQYEFRVGHAGRTLAQGRAVVSVASRS